MGGFIGGHKPIFYSGWNQANLVDGLLHVMESQDGRTFTARSGYNNYTPHDSSDIGCPALTFSNGQIWVVGSLGIDLNWTGTTTEVATSTDGNNFTYVTSIDWSDVCSGSKPEVFPTCFFQDTDGSLYVIAECVGAATVGAPGNQLFIKKALNSGLTSWSSGTQITGTSLPSSILDGFMLKQGGTYYIFYKNQSAWPNNQYIEVMSSSSISSGYSIVESADWAGWGQPYEAPQLVNFGGNNWRIYLDPLGGGMRYSESATGLFGTWSAPTAVTSPISLQHGSVIYRPF